MKALDQLETPFDMIVSWLVNGGVPKSRAVEATTAIMESSANGTIEKLRQKAYELCQISMEKRRRMANQKKEIKR